MTYSECIEYLFSALANYERVGLAGYKPGIERVQSFVEKLGSPHRHFLTIHVAGTNGKGSVSHTIASILQSAGYKTGLYTSPHIKDFTERIRVGQEMIPRQAVVDFVELYKAEIDKSGLSFFEISFAMALHHFSAEGVDVAVIETGLGGRLDATNLIVPILSVITNVGLDHTELLGDTIEKVAVEKAGIIKNGVPVVIGEHSCDVVFEQRAKEKNAPLYFADQLLKNVDGYTYIYIGGEAVELEFPLNGDYQKKNLMTVLAVIEVLNSDSSLNISQLAVKEGCRDVVKNTALVGRWQKIGDSPDTFCDVAHNADAFKEVFLQLSKRGKRCVVVLGFMSDKDFLSVLALAPKGFYYIFTQSGSPRAMKADLLAKQAERLGLECETIEKPQEALDRAREIATPQGLVFVGGSFYILSEIL